MAAVGLAVLSALLAVGLCLGWLRLADAVCARLPGGAGLRPWLFLGPGVVFVLVYLVWPMLATVGISLRGPGGIGAGHYLALAQDPRFRAALLTNILWVLVVPALATAVGLLAAALTRGRVVRALIFLPGAISATGAAVIWKLVYEYRPPGQPQTGLLNALMAGAGADPRPWLTMPGLNDALLMAVMVWTQAGFAMVVLAAALRALPEDVTRAAVLDGAGPVRLFLRIRLPQIRGAVATVWITLTVVVLKVFDIVFVMTNGQWGTQVLSGLMFERMFRAADPGGAAAIAVVMGVLILPFAWRATGRGAR